jgi:hypothetical protein
LSDLSAGANTAASNNDSSSGPTTTVAPPSAKSRKNPIESKAQKPSFLSLIFCCGANFVNDSDGSALQVGPTRPPTVSTGRAAGKKIVAAQLTEEKPTQAQPSVVDVAVTAVQEDPVGVSCLFQPQEASLNGLFSLFFHHGSRIGLAMQCTAPFGSHSIFSLLPTSKPTCILRFAVSLVIFLGYIGSGHDEQSGKRKPQGWENPRHLDLFNQLQAGSPWITAHSSPGLSLGCQGPSYIVRRIANEHFV